MSFQVNTVPKWKHTHLQAPLNWRLQVFTWQTGFFFFCFFFCLFFFSPRGEESTFWNQYSQLVFLQIKAAILRLVSPGTSTERQRRIRTAAVKFYISSKKDRNVILHYLKMRETEREREREKERGMGKHIHQKGAQMLFLCSDRIGKNIQKAEKNKNIMTWS